VSSGLDAQHSILIAEITAFPSIGVLTMQHMISSWKKVTELNCASSVVDSSISKNLTVSITPSLSATDNHLSVGHPPPPPGVGGVVVLLMNTCYD
jgi:hypothetical protein